MSVLLDVDGVLADFIGGIIPIIKAVTGRDVTHDEIDQFDFSAALQLSPEHAGKVKRAIGSSGRMASFLSVFDGAKEGVRRLRDIADLYIVTSPWNSNETWCHDRERWLHRHFDIPHSRVIHTSAKHLIRGDVFVDDKTSALEAWRIRNPQGVAVQWRTPHNRNEAWDGPSTSNWQRISEIALGIGDAMGES